MIGTIRYNPHFVRVHKTLRVKPEMAAGVNDRLREMEWTVGLIDERSLEPKKPWLKPGTRYAPRK